LYGQTSTREVKDAIMKKQLNDCVTGEWKKRPLPPPKQINYTLELDTSIALSD
jgi:hypothetical protein